MSSLIALSMLVKLGTLFSKKFATKKMFTGVGIGLTGVSQYQKHKYYKERNKQFKNDRRRYIEREDNFEL